MRSRTNFAPTAPTIIVSLVLMIVGLLCSYGPLLNDQVGVIAFVMAIVLLLLGMVFRQI